MIHVYGSCGETDRKAINSIIGSRADSRLSKSRVGKRSGKTPKEAGCQCITGKELWWKRGHLESRKSRETEKGYTD